MAQEEKQLKQCEWLIADIFTLTNTALPALDNNPAFQVARPRWYFLCHE
jgi:hypothetical protein